jgi:MFS family permease
LEQDISYKYHSDLATETLWPVTVYFLANAIMQRVFVALTDIFGRRIMLFSAVAIFTIGAVVLSVTPPLFPILVAGRGLQGIGSGGMVAIPSAMLIEMIPTQRRSRYNCIILLCAAIGAGTGPVVGGLFTEKGIAENGMAWRWIYWISGPYCLVLLISIPFAVQPVGEFLSPKMRLLSIDWTGISIFCASMSGLLIGITWSGGGDPSTNWRTLLALAAGGIGMMCWLLYERSGATKPFFSFSILSKSPVTFFGIFLHSFLVSKPRWIERRFADDH